MIDLIKILLVLISSIVFVYCLNLSFQGRLEMKVILEDIAHAKEYAHSRGL